MLNNSLPIPDILQPKLMTYQMNATKHCAHKQLTRSDCFDPEQPSGQVKPNFYFRKSHIPLGTPISNPLRRRLLYAAVSRSSRTYCCTRSPYTGECNTLNYTLSLTASLMAVRANPLPRRGQLGKQPQAS